MDDTEFSTFVTDGWHPIAKEEYEQLIIDEHSYHEQRKLDEQNRLKEELDEFDWGFTKQ